MPVKFPCEICEEAVAGNHRAVCCDICNIWVHIKCNRINTQTYNILKKENASWSCIECSKSIFLFENWIAPTFLQQLQAKISNLLQLGKSTTHKKGF